MASAYQPSARSGSLAASVSTPSRPPQNTYVVAPSSTPRSIARIVFCSAYARTLGSFAVNAPSRKTGSRNRLVVAIGTTRPVASSAFLKSATI